MPRKSPFISAEPFVPDRPTLPSLRQAAKGCTGCDLYERATRTVFGEGPSDALVMFISEQPGDQEDRTGRPFVGPAGQVLDDGMRQAGIDRRDVYVTNVVKHFKWEPRGKRRVHAKPDSRQIAACKPWLAAELQVVKPRMVVCLGATAAQALIGPEFRITQDRGKPLRDLALAPWVMATMHPSAILRMPDAATRESAFRQFVEDMRIVAGQLTIEKAHRPAAAPPGRTEHIWHPEPTPAEMPPAPGP